MAEDIFFAPRVYIYERLFIRRRKAMQRRYCSCGASVMVEYRFSGRGWTTVISLGRRLFRKHREVCPCCGRALHIDELA
jgi:hypothetical protein